MTRDDLVTFFQREGYIVCLDEQQEPDCASFVDGPGGASPYGVILNPRDREPGRVYRPSWQRAGSEEAGLGHGERA